MHINCIGHQVVSSEIFADTIFHNKDQSPRMLFWPCHLHSMATNGNWNPKFPSVENLSLPKGLKFSSIEHGY